MRVYVLVFLDVKNIILVGDDIIMLLT